MENLKGCKFNDLTVLSYHHKQGSKHYWLCKCSCGQLKIARSDCLKRNEVKTCDCCKNNKHKKNGFWSKNPRLYKIFESMHRRCYDNKNPNYKYYGGRGITVCDEWEKNNIENFYYWALNNGYKDNLTIDRIDINGNYCPENCRWVDMKVQNNNKRNNHFLYYKGIKATIAQWSKFLNLTERKMTYHLNKGKELKDIIKENNKTISFTDLIEFVSILKGQN